MASLSADQIQKFVACLEPQAPSTEGAQSEKITVHAAVSRVSVLYEKVRNALDYKDEHLLRKAALTRILQRQLTFGGGEEAIAKQLVKELIAAGYLPNGTVSVDMVVVVQGILHKYFLMRQIRAGNDGHLRWDRAEPRVLRFKGFHLGHRFFWRFICQQNQKIAM